MKLEKTLIIIDATMRIYFKSSVTFSLIVSMLEQKEKITHMVGSKMSFEIEFSLMY